MPGPKREQWATSTVSDNSMPDENYQRLTRITRFISIPNIRLLGKSQPDSAEDIDYVESREEIQSPGGTLLKMSSRVIVRSLIKNPLCRAYSYCLGLTIK